MAKEAFPRRLSAILSADAVGYSRLMQDDEEATVRTITEYRTVITHIVRQHRGRVVDSPGDNLLAEFASVVDAVQCAVAIQKELHARNANLPESRRMQFRVGINLGDIIEEKDRIYGDGVNIAARLEALADPGGICVSKTAFDHIETKLPLGYEFLGDHKVKNIAKPVAAYRVLMESRVTIAGKGKKSAASFWQRRGVLACVLAVFMAIVGVFLWNVYLRSSPMEVASAEKMAFPLPNKPSIAVLPFVNMGGDPEQDYFSDGITDDLITDLSKISGIFVISRNTTFTYKGKPVKIRRVSEELGVRYVLEGSVRKEGDKVRINAQLIDATTGGHLWAERYDGQTEDIFSLQDKITKKIVEALAVKLTIHEKAALPKIETESIKAYLNFLKGWQYYRKFDPDSFSRAIPLLNKAVELDSNYGRANALLAKIYLELRQRYLWRNRLGITRQVAFNKMIEYLQKAMNNPTALAFAVSAKYRWTGGDLEGAIAEAKQAVSLDPNDPESHLAMGLALLFNGRYREAADSFKVAMRLDPLQQDTFGYLLGWAYFHMLQYDKAIKLCEKSLKSNPENPTPLWVLTAAYAHSGRQREAEESLIKLRKLESGYSQLFYLQHILRYKNSEDYNLLADGLQKAGMN